MASCDVQVVNPAVLSRIESFLNDAAYREAIDNSANYNTRLCLERRLRLPFLDSQTGIAQNHSNLFMSGRERIPGQVDGQLYTYPSKRWRKKRRQYLMQPQVQLRRCDLSGVGMGAVSASGVGVPGSGGPGVGGGSGGGDSSSGGDLHSISTIENPAVAGSTDDSKDSNSTGLKDDPSGKSSQDAWFYDELELQGMDGYDDVDPDSDYDYEETYSKRRKKRGGGAKPGPKGSSGTPASTDSPHPKKGTKGTGQGRGRKKGVNYGELLDSEKPFSCDLCGARYKTRPGLTYHYTHSHKDGRCAGTSASGTGSSAGAGAAGNVVASSATAAGGGGGMAGPPPASTTASGLIPVAIDEEPSSMDLAPMSPQQQHNSHQDNPAPGWTKFQDSYLTFLNAPGSSGRRGRQSASASTGVQHPQPHHTESDLPPMSGPSIEKKPMQEPVLVMEQNDKERAAPSPYCDFCLGDAVSNKKSGQPEELVSCSDCGRSGHPSCLQFTDNMIVSVRKYRWQCIECKCCSICGTSDNDDQLLFCDDCDRGYHMYCLSPPLEAPPEGSWSCRLCIVEFHTK